MLTDENTHDHLSRAVSATPSRHIFVLLNGKKSGDRHLRAAVKHLREEGHLVDVRVTWEHDDVERYTAEAIKAKTVNTVVAAGGDGTVNEVATALIKLDASKSLAMAVVPMGTANDFATSLGLPEDPWEALQLCVLDTAHPIDVGQVNDKIFMNMATGGFGTEVTVKTDPKLKQQLGGAAYIITGLTSFSSIASKQATLEGPAVSTVKKDVRLYQISKPQPAASVDSITRREDDVEDAEEPCGSGQASSSGRHRPIPDGQKLHVQGQLLILAVGNGRQAGGGMRLCPYAGWKDGQKLVDLDLGHMRLCPYAVLDDGLLDVSYIMNYPQQQVPGLLKELMRGRDEDDTLELMDSFGSMRVPWLEVHCADGLQINCDGEPLRDTHFSFKVLPRRLMLHMPQPKLLRQPSSVLNTAQERYKKKMGSQIKRPARKPKATIWGNAIVRSILTNGLVLGVGVVLTIGVQRIQERRGRTA